MESLDLTKYPNIDAATWRDFIEKELKGKSWKDLIWQPEELLALEAGYHTDDSFSALYLPNIKNGDWLIGESFNIDDNAEQVNGALLEALNMGLEAPEFTITASTDISLLLNDVLVEYLDTTWHIENEEAIKLIYKSLSINAPLSDTLSGSISYPYSLGPSFIQRLKIFLALEKEFPACATFRIFQITPEAGLGIVETVAQVLAAANALLDSVGVEFPDGIQVLKRLQINIKNGDLLMLEMAKIRAIRLTFQNLLKARKIMIPQSIFINVATDEQIYKEDDNYNRIKASLIGWSAAIGGADRITIVPGGQSETSFDKRIARNVQHLLKMESFLGKVADPMQGSYYVEAATRQIAQLAWERFKILDKEGDYYNGKPLVQ